MQDAEHSSIRLSRDDYREHTSNGLISVYHTSGYLSPPYSASRSSRMDSSFTAESSGLGITQSASPRDDVSTPYSSPSTMFSLSYSNHQHHALYDENINICENEGRIQASPYGWQPDPVQEGKWVVSSHDERPNLCETTPRPYWQTDYRQDYSIYCQHPGIQFFDPPSQTMTVHRPAFLSYPRFTEASTPPASHENSPIHDSPDIRQEVVCQNSSSVNDDQGFQHVTSQCFLPSTGTLNTCSLVKSRSKNGRRLLGRLPKKAAPVIPRPLLQCRQCSKTFSKQSKLKDHENAHGKLTVACPEHDCTKVYGRQADLARHQRSHHKGHMFPCRYCEKLFNRSDITRRHEEHSCRQRRAENVKLGLTQQNLQPRQ